MQSQKYFLDILQCSDVDFLWSKTRSGHSDVFCKKGVLRNFTKFTGKHLCKSFFFNKVAGLRPDTDDRGVFLWILWNF